MNSSEDLSNPDETSLESPLRKLSTSRRGFIAGAATAPLAGGLFGGRLMASEGGTRTSAAAPGSYQVNKLVLALDDKPSGFLKSADGGEAYAEVILEPDKFFDRKAPGKEPLYENIVLQAGMGMSKAFYQWISATWEGEFKPRDGAIETVDFDGKPQAQRNFHEALIVETRFPALDGSSKETCFMTLELDPATTELVRPSVELPKGGKSKQWLCSNFRLKLGKLDCTRVSKIESFAVKMTDPRGDARMQFPNLKISLAESSSAGWYKWYNNSVLGGEEQEFEGTISVLDPTLKDELMSIDLEGVGIVRLSPERQVAGDDSILRVVAELYVELMHFNGPTA